MDQASKVALLDHKVSMSNALARAGTTLSLIEKRLVAAAVAQLDSRRAVPEAGATVVTEVLAEDYAAAYGLEMTTAYQELRQGAAHLYARSIRFYEPPPKSGRGRKAREPVLVTMRWVSAVKYHAGAGRVELHWTPHLLPHLLELKRNFTSYRLEQASALRSVYSWRLLEIAQSFRHGGVFEMALEELHDRLEVPSSFRANFAHFRLNVLERMDRDFSREPPWAEERMQLSWEAVRHGRKVVAVRFRFARVAQPEIPGLDAAPEPAFQRFPRSGRIDNNAFWSRVFRASGCKRDRNLVGADFLAFCSQRKISLSDPSIVKTFETFAAGSQVAGAAPRPPRRTQRRAPAANAAEARAWWLSADRNTRKFAVIKLGIAYPESADLQDESPHMVAAWELLNELVAAPDEDERQRAVRAARRRTLEEAPGSG